MKDYASVKGFSPMIREVIRTDRMPPYNADPHVGKFSDNKNLSPDEIKTLVHWVEAGAPRGDGPDPLAARKHVAQEWHSRGCWFLPRWRGAIFDYLRMTVALAPISSA